MICNPRSSGSAPRSGRVARVWSAPVSAAAIVCSTIIAASPLGGCASSTAVRPETTAAIPPPPTYLHPVEVARPKAGENALLIAKRERLGRERANAVIGAARRDWECLRAGLAGEPAGERCETRP